MATLSPEPRAKAEPRPHAIIMLVSYPEDDEAADRALAALNGVAGLIEPEGHFAPLLVDELANTLFHGMIDFHQPSRTGLDADFIRDAYALARNVIAHQSLLSLGVVAEPLGSGLAQQTVTVRADLYAIGLLRLAAAAGRLEFVSK